MSHALLRSVVVMFVVVGFASLAGAQEKRLDYRQQKDLDDAVGYLDQCEGTLQEIAKRMDAMKVGDANVPIGDVKNLISNKTSVDRYLGFCKARFAKLPAEHSAVKPEIARYEKLVKSSADMDDKLKALDSGLGKVVEQGTGAGFQADFKRLREITQMFDDQIFNSQPQRAVDVCKQMAAVKNERQRIAQKYADLLKQDTPASNDTKGTLNYFDERFGTFEKAANNYAAEAPNAIGADVDEALKMATDAVQNNKPLFFRDTGGVQQRLNWAQTKYDVLAAISPDGAGTTSAKAKIESGRQQVTQMKAAMMQAIVTNNTVPEERYNGPDKAQLIVLVKSKWAESGIKSPVLKVGINSSEWTRDVRWEWDGTSTWHKVDKSHAQGHVIVKLDDKLAAVYYVNLVQDHLAGDKITAHFFDDLKVEPDASRKMLVGNVK